MNRIEELKAKYIKAADEAIAKGFKLSRHGAGYIDTAGDEICINAAVALEESMDDRSYQVVAAEKLGIEFQEARCVEGGFCNWTGEDYQTHPEFYNLGVELRTLYNA